MSMPDDPQALPNPPPAPPPPTDGQPPAGAPPQPEAELDFSALDRAAELARVQDPNFKGWSIPAEELKQLPEAAQRYLHNKTSDYGRKMAEVGQQRAALAAERARLEADRRVFEEARSSYRGGVKELALPPLEGEPPDGMTDPDGRAAWFARQAVHQELEKQQKATAAWIEQQDRILAETREHAMIEAWAEANPAVKEPKNQQAIVAVINDQAFGKVVPTPQQAWELLQDPEALTPNGKAAIVSHMQRFAGMDPVSAWRYEKYVVQQHQPPERRAHDRAVELGGARSGRPAFRPMPTSGDLNEIRAWKAENPEAASAEVARLQREGLAG